MAVSRISKTLSGAPSTQGGGSSGTSQRTMFAQAARSASPTVQAAPAGAVTVQAILDEASRHLGAAYNAGAGRTWSADVEKPGSFDCSGLWLYVGRRTGLGDIGWVSDAQYANAKSQGLNVDDMELARRTPGMMLFKPGTGPNGHVAVVYNAEGDTIESTRGGVQIIKGGAFKSYYTQAAYMPGVDYSAGGSGTGPATGAEGGPVEMTGANDLYADPAYQMATLAALLGGTDPAELEAAAAGTTTTGTPEQLASSGDWRSDVLAKLGYQPTEENLRVMEAWKNAEDRSDGASSRYNWLNTTQSADGATSVNSHGVKKYTSYEQGIDATVKTLQNGRYAEILAGLASGTNAANTASAIDASVWGTKNVRKVLG